MRRVIFTTLLVGTMALVGCEKERATDERPAEPAVTVEKSPQTVTEKRQEDVQPAVPVTLTKREVSAAKEGFTPADQLRALATIGELRKDPAPLNDHITVCRNDNEADGCDVLMPLVESAVVQYAIDRPRHHLSDVLSQLHLIATQEKPVREGDVMVSDLDVGGPKAMETSKECVLLRGDRKPTLTPEQQACSETLATFKTGGPHVHSLPDDAGKTATQAAAMYIVGFTQGAPGNLYQRVQQCKQADADLDCEALMSLLDTALAQREAEMPLHDLDLILSRITYLATTQDPLYITVIADDDADK